jgi:hypothetical protein
MSKKKIIIIAGVAIVVVLGLIGYGVATGKFGANLGFSSKEELADNANSNDGTTPDGQKCNSDAKAFFAKSNRVKDASAKFFSHYNTQMKKCFIETTDFGKDTTTKFIIDIGATPAQTYARAYVPVSKTATFSCMVADKICLTQQDYDDYFNRIMKN